MVSSSALRVLGSSRVRVAPGGGGGESLDVFFDPVGGAAAEAAFRTQGRGGRRLVVGFPAGMGRLPTNLALLGEAALLGVNLDAFRRHRPEAARQVLA
ncbi:MAG: hypothetical protein KatS3mg124_0174 [Porticoccaceae bacterium]|nr:MAG: hypothetical protein KatS3mg124_0174 [Porticoccaceae bacterium]